MTGRVPGALPEELAELHPDRWTAPFWEAAAEHRLVAARCRSCGASRMPPTAYCPHCRSQVVEMVELPGTGRVYTFTVVRHAVIPAVRDHLPYVLAVIELDGGHGARLVANVLGVEPDDVHIDMAVQVAWDDIDAGTTIPRFVPAAPEP